MESKHHHGHDVGERFYLHRHTVVHALPVHLKLLATIGFVLVAVLTPVTWYPAFAGYATLLAVLIMIAQLPWRAVAVRTLIEVPFVLFAFLLPFFVPGPRIEVLGIGMSQPGLEQAFGILAKGTIGVVATVILASTSTVSDLLKGLQRLRVPSAFIHIATFMLRYANVVTDEMRRMRVARESRGFSATGVRSWPVLGQSAGALFIRSYERGERVHLAMLSRGFAGTFHQGTPVTATHAHHLQAAAVPVAATLVLLVTMLVRS